jgi:hypothetical protein
MSHLGRVALFVDVALSLGTAAPPAAFGLPMQPERPPPSDACRAWREHIGDLIDQHRVALDIDEDALFDFVRQFNAARDACLAGSFELGLKLYGDIQLGPVHGAALK